MEKECCKEKPESNSGSNTSKVHHSGGHDHSEHDEDHDHDHGGSESNQSFWKTYGMLLASFGILSLMLLMEYGFHIIPAFPFNLMIYLVAYLLAGYNVLFVAYKKAMHFDFFNEFFLMTVATVGAFAIGAYSEGVAVMVFYSIGEGFQDYAVSKAKKSIKALLDIRPDVVTVIRDEQELTVNAGEIKLEEIIRAKPGEKIALDGILLSERSSFNTAALTGESKPDTKVKGEKIFAGMINLNTVSEIQVKALFKDSKLSKILEMVQDATAKKSNTQLFISRFAKVYTPIVFFLALAVCFTPYFFTDHYVFQEWFYRSLVFLVISCPCALVVSIPLGYFGGIGLASRNGILFKGSNFLDVVTKINVIVMDKTGTLTKGVFKVQDVVTESGEALEFLKFVVGLESNSTHPIAKAILEYAGKKVLEGIKIENVEEIPGHGLKGIIEGKEVLAGNIKLLKKFNISFPEKLETIIETIVIVSIANKYAGYILIADELKEDSKQAITGMHDLNLETMMLSGDKQSVVDKIGGALNIHRAFGDLLPEDKVAKIQELKGQGVRVGFVGDGINDAPVVALADIGFAMGGLGSDATIETADVVIQNDQPSKILSAIRIGKITRNIVWQNICLAMLVKIIVLVLGAGGIANLWEAVIADVGVALLAILNAVRIQHMRV